MGDDLSGKTILVVDDDREMLAALQEAFNEQGATVVSASDGDAAVRQVEQAQPDVMILDMMLPRRSGLLVLEKLIQARESRSEMPQVVMITGNPGQRHRAYAENLGVQRYFTKPFRMEKLVEAVKELAG
jgi:DNA-binding response OmpR family regulator